MAWRSVATQTVVFSSGMLFCASSEETVEFVRHLQDQTATELPTSVTFECELSRPNAKVQWMKGDRPIVHDRKHEIVVDGAVHRLVIRDVTGQSDVAEYSANVRGLTSKASLVLQGSFQFVMCLRFTP